MMRTLRVYDTQGDVLVVVLVGDALNSESNLKQARAQLTAVISNTPT
jgi:hypothetical protein